MPNLNIPADKLAKALTHLEPLSADEGIRTALIARGYSDLASIASTPRAKFIETMREAIGESEAQRMYVLAAGKAAYENSMWAKSVNKFEEQIKEGREIGDLHGYGSIGHDDLPGGATQTTSWDTATSLLAYLADLLNYAVSRLQKNGSSMIVADLERLLHQPFSDLLAYPDYAKKPILQVRACVEVLRRFLDSIPLSDTKKVSLAAAEKDYRQAAYMRLLLAHGTSYEALRLARGGQPENQLTVADRMDIDQSHLPDLFISPDEVTEAKLEELFGLSQTTPASKPSTAAMLPKLLQWQLDELRKWWLEQDRPTNRYQQRLLPIIDPDLIGPDDFRWPEVPAATEPPSNSSGSRPGGMGRPPQSTHTDNFKAAFGLWLKRRIWVDKWLKSFERRGELPSHERWANVFTTMYGSASYSDVSEPTWKNTIQVHEFPILKSEICRGVNLVEDEKRIREELCLTLPSFLRLMEIYEKDTDGSTYGTTPISQEDWLEVCSILTQAHKVRLYETWCKEEQDLGLLLGPRDFWISLHQPVSGEWPIRQNERPLLDPEQCGEDGLPDETVANRYGAKRLWEQRHEKLTLIREDLQSEHQVAGFDAMLIKALGAVNPNDPKEPLLIFISKLEAALKSGQDLVATQAAIVSLYLSVEEFTRLVQIRASEQTSVQKPANRAEYAEAYRILTSAYKQRVEYPNWMLEEISNGLAYWMLRKAQLPRWRASLEGFQEWQQALIAHSQPSILDPDAVGYQDFRNLDENNPIYALWNQRRVLIQSTIKQLLVARRKGADDLSTDLYAQFDAILAATLNTYDDLGFAAGEIWSLEQRRLKGEDISARLAQLGLEEDAFGYLIRIGTLAKKNQPILDTEWEGVYEVLLQTIKRRRSAKWQAEESQQSLAIDPDLFQPVPTGTGPSATLPLAMRNIQTQRLSWQAQLQTRLDQKQALLTGFNQTIGTVEASCLPSLRNALIDATGSDVESLNSQATYLEDRLLIALQANSTQETTRLNQAVDTVQKLVWAVRTGLLTDIPALKDYKLTYTRFDEEWRTLGSYANWCAAMKVFFYPENTLQPQLRSRQSAFFKELTARYDHLPLELARKAAAEYADYLRDISKITLAACVEVVLPTNATRYGYRSYGFGRSSVSNKTYWAARNASAELEQSQTFWEEISCFGTNVVALSGAAQYQNSIYLFAETVGTYTESQSVSSSPRGEQQSSKQLVFARYDLEQGIWSSTTLVDLQAILGKQQSGSTSPAFHALLKRTASTEPPCLIVHADKTWVCRMNAQGTGWATFDEAKAPDLALEVNPIGWYHVGPIPNNSASADLDFALSEPVQQAVSGDFDGDGQDEIAVISGNSLRILDLETGSKERKWNSAQTFGFNPAFLLSGNFNGEKQDQIAFYLGDRFQFITFKAGKYVMWEYPFDCKDVKHALVGDFNGDGQDEIAICIESQQDGYIKYMYFNKTLQQPQWQTLDTYSWLPLRPDEFIVAGQFFEDKTAEHPKFQLLIGRRKDDGHTGFSIINYGPNASSTQQDSSYDEELIAPCKFGIVGDFEGIGRDAIAVAVLGVSGSKATFHVVDATASAFKHMGLFKAGPYSNDLDIRFAVAGDFDGDEMDEIAIAWNTSGSRCNDFSVMDYDVSSDSWRELSQIDGYDSGTSFVCSRSLYPAQLAVTGHFDGDLLYSIAVFTDATNNNGAWVMKLAATPLVYSGPYNHNNKLSGSEILEQRQKYRKLINGQGVNLQHIEEALYFLPVFLARGLENAGDYVAALDWWRVVYDYSNVSPEERWIYPWLDSKSTITYNRGLNWMLEALNPHILASMRPGTYQRFTLMSLAQCLVSYADAEFTSDTSESLARAQSLYITALEQLDQLVVTEHEDQTRILEIRIAGVSYPFSISPNLILKSIRRRIEINLYKLRNGRNIAGMQGLINLSDSAETGSTGILRTPWNRQSTLYRHKVLIERARQLVQTASQMESLMLSALEKKDAEAYNIMKARQDMELTQYQVQLQSLRVDEAREQNVLAVLQKDKAQQQVDRYSMLLSNGGLLVEESNQINLLSSVILLQRTAAALQWSLTSGAYVEGGEGRSGRDLAGRPLEEWLSGWGCSGGNGGFGISTSFQTYPEMMRRNLSDNISLFGAIANVASTQATLESVKAGYIRRQQEWEFQKLLADWDVTIGNQQIALAQIHESVVQQEKAITEVQARHAQAVVDFLSTKFTNVELYDCMARIMEGVYRFFLQQATSVARLAANQLAFERPDSVPPMIAAHYWETPPSNSAGQTTGGTEDRRGLTGSARLLQDIQRLDQYAFETDTRKLQITRTISLAGLVPYEFQRFRESGVLTFRTPMALFDYDFPGHYLRLIKRVRTTLIALIPPSEGIKATLTSSGISRVVVGQDTFRTIVLRRDPETVALSAPINAAGVFELEPQTEMLLPFEASGVDTAWEFSMPRAANRFDYRTIADVLLTIDYTALSSPDYRREVIQNLDPILRTERVFSIRDQFPDGWYSLNNAEQKNEQAIAVSMQTRLEDFPPFAETPIIQNVLLYFATKEESSLPISSVKLTFTPSGSGTGTVGGDATPGENGVCSILSGGCGNWLPMIGSTVAGSWKLTVPNTEGLREAFRDGAILDVLLIISYAARLPEWPE